MIGLLCLFLVLVAAPFKKQSRLEAENAALRHQLIVLRRKMQRRVRLTNSDRWFFIQLYRWSIIRVTSHYFFRGSFAGLSNRARA